MNANLNNDNLIEELKKLHYETFHLIDKKDWVKLNRRMKEIRFMHNVNKSKMVLVATQSFVNLPEIMEERYLLYQWFNQDIGLSYMNAIPLFKEKDLNVPNKYKNNNNGNEQ